MTDSVKVNLGEFHGLLTDLARTALRDDCLPALNSVLLYGAKNGDEPVLVGESTNRYVIGQAHMSAEGSFGRLLLPLDSVKALTAALRPHVKVLGLWDVAVDEGFLSVECPGTSVRVRVDAGVAFVSRDSVARFFRPMADHASEVQWDARYIEMFSAVAKRRKAHLRFEVAAGMHGSVVRIGDRYRGVIMPVRLDAHRPAEFDLS